MYDKEIRLFHKYEKFESDLEYAMSFGSLSKLEEKIKEMEERMKRKVVMHLDGYDGDSCGFGDETGNEISCNDENFKRGNYKIPKIIILFLIEAMD